MSLRRLHPGRFAGKNGNPMLDLLGQKHLTSILIPGIAAVAFSLAPQSGPVISRTAHAAPTPQPFATLLFSRTEMTAADNCVPSDTGIARLDTEIAPYIQSMGMTATGTLATDRVMQSTQKCTHFNNSMMGSWDDMTNLSNSYGWTFVSHTASFPSTLQGLSSTQSDAETCGSANTITAHGLSGANGMIAYPGASGDARDIQANYGSKCFAWGRMYGGKGITSSTAATTAPYWQRTHAGNGGPCTDNTQPCSKIVMQNGSTRYTNPSELIGYVNSTTPDMWFTFQSFILVKDKSPAYSKGGIAWDCTSSNPALHWTNDNERYCYDDFKAVVAAIAAKGMKVTDPLSVGIAYGRPATYPTSALSTGDTTPPSDPTNFQASATSSSSVVLAWDASTDNIGVTGYRVERSTDQTSWTSLASRYTGTSYVDATAAANTQYYYSVSAVDAAGNVSGWATAAATTPQAPPPDTTPPTMPSGFVATPAADRADVSLVWDASTDDTGVTSYCVERSTDQSDWTTLSSNQTARTFTDSSTTYSTHYYYRVSAVDAAANRSDYATTSVVTSNQPVITTRQYVANQSLEGTSATGWAPYSSTSAIAVVKVIGGSIDGSYALRVTNSQSSTGVAGLSDKAPRWVSSTVANRTYTGSMWLSGTPNTAITVQLRECTVTGSSCPALARVRANLPVSGWVQATVTYQARSNNNQLRFSAFGTLAAKDSFLADAFSITSPIS